MMDKAAADILAVYKHHNEVRHRLVLGFVDGKVAWDEVEAAIREAGDFYEAVIASAERLTLVHTRAPLDRRAIQEVVW